METATLDQSNLVSKSGLKTWHENGFIFFRSKEVLGELVAGNLANVVENLERSPESPSKEMRYYETTNDGKRLLNRIENFLPFCERLDALFNFESKIGRIVSNLFQEEAAVFKDKINFKKPGGGGFEAHQDAQASWDRYGHTMHITAMVAVDRATKENGCLEVVPKMNHNGLIGPMGEPIPNETVEKLNFLPVEMDCGDVLFFDSYVPHRSSINNSKRARRILYITYNKRSEGDHREQYFVDKRREFPPDINRQAGIDYVYKV